MSPISKKIQQQKLAEIIENFHHRFQQNDIRMTEIGKKLAPMADAPTPEKAKLWQQFHQLEDEQTSILTLIDRLNGKLI